MKPQAPSVIDYPELRAQKARVGLTCEDLVEITGCSVRTVSHVLNGKESLHIKSIMDVAAGLGMRVRVTFEPIPTEANAENVPLKLVA